jgi:glycerol-3-phosphate acyltransferase PlsY
MPAYQFALLVIGAYLLGSVPAAYIAGRLLKGIDIRKYGSGVSSGSNVWHSVSRWAIIPVGVFDVLKGAIPVAIAYPVLDFPMWAQAVVGLAAISGHSWSVFLGFSGGRGFATMVGVLLIFAPWELIIFTFLSLLLLFLIKVSPLSMLIATAVMVISSIWLPNGPTVPSADGLTRTWCLLAISLLLILKRLLGEHAIPKKDWKRIMLYRFILDRDTRNREAWIYRTPSGKGDKA